MTALGRRRLVGMVSAVLLFAALWIGAEVHRLALGHTGFYSGWALLGGVVLLGCYGLRKRLRSLPLGRASTWLQVHLYVGVVTLALFLVHMQAHLPYNTLGIALMTVFLIVMASGVAGIWIDRRVAHRLRAAGDEIVYERIPGAIAALRDGAEEEVLAVAGSTRSRVLADAYGRDVAPFLDGTRDRWRHLFDMTTRGELIDGELTRLRRYVGDEEGQAIDDLRATVAAKSRLDRQAALQFAMRGWLFVHGPLTLVLGLLVGCHVVLVYAFGGPP